VGNGKVNLEKSSETLSSIESLIRLIETLRGDNGCPWDRQQTPRSISVYLTEEIYELIDAIESDDPDRVCEELGDVLFHILFIARIYEEYDRFDIGRVAGMIAAKMIRRHPHVFGERKLETPDQVRDAWEKIIFGTDVAYYEARDLLQDYDHVIRTLGLSEEIKWKILGGTAAQIYGVNEE
jgi:tetrapyrrole methylase family protein/MazG family protein